LSQLMDIEFIKPCICVTSSVFIDLMFLYLNLRSWSLTKLCYQIWIGSCPSQNKDNEFKKRGEIEEMSTCERNGTWYM